MAKKKKQKTFQLWSPSIIGSIYFDKKGNWWFYDESKNKIHGASEFVLGKTARVIPHSFNKYERKIRAII